MRIGLSKEELNNLSRDEYIEVYNKLGDYMFDECDVPTAYDISVALTNNQAMKKLTKITDFTGNQEEIENSINRKALNYTQEDTDKFIESVIASNVTDITESGYFYKKLMASCDNMEIEGDDCGAVGDPISIPISKEEYNYKVRSHFITELNDFTLSFEDFCNKTRGFKEVHIRSFLSCEQDPNHRKFCKKCAGLYLRSFETESFTPKHIGLYSTLMITEKATQSSLDSMNKGVTEKVTKILEQKLERDFNSYNEVKEKINEIINYIGYIGVMSKYYEIALLSRFYRVSNSDKFHAYPLLTSLSHQKDPLGWLIFQANKRNLYKLFNTKKINNLSNKTKLMLDIFDDE